MATAWASNCFISFRGQLTKCPTEHVRKASALESISAGAWEAAVDEVVNAAKNDMVVNADAQVPDSEEEMIPGTPAPMTPAMVPLTASPPLTGEEVIATLGPEVSGHYIWRSLESAVEYPLLPNQHALVGKMVPVLITVFHPGAAITFLPPDQQKKVG